MKPVGDHGLVCLDGTDYSAIPLILQENAEVIDSLLTTETTNFTTYNNRPWAVVTGSSNVTVFNNLNEWNGVSNYPGTSVISGPVFTGSGFPAATWPNVSPSMPTGWYYVGGSVNFAATGVVNANTRREIIIEWRKFQTGISSYEYTVNSIFESNTGGDSLATAGFFFADGEHLYTPDLMFNHRNTSSSLLTTSARMWIFYVGTGTVI